ncbi:hypothetical protein Droror1_Dr00016379 [Drosera rotundifolia]
MENAHPPLQRPLKVCLNQNLDATSPHSPKQTRDLTPRSRFTDNPDIQLSKPEIQTASNQTTTFNDFPKSQTSRSQIPQDHEPNHNLHASIPTIPTATARVFLLR